MYNSTVAYSSVLFNRVKAAPDQKDIYVYLRFKSSVKEMLKRCRQQMAVSSTANHPLIYFDSSK